MSTTTPTIYVKDWRDGRSVTVGRYSTAALVSMVLASHRKDNR